MPERFDLLRIHNIDKDYDSLALAPCYEIKPGDTVDTAFGRAFVLDRACFCSPEDPVMKLLNGLVQIDRVLFKVQPVKYEDD